MFRNAPHFSFMFSTVPDEDLIGVTSFTIRAILESQINVYV
jgi:hypothetical protein